MNRFDRKSNQPVRVLLKMLKKFCAINHLNKSIDRKGKMFDFVAMNTFAI